MMNDELAYLTPSDIPPLEAGGTRLRFATRAEILNDFLDFPKWDALLDKNRIVTQMSHDGSYVVDVVPLDSQVE